MRILLVEDDLMLGKALKNALENENNIVDWMTDIDSSQTALKTTKYEILLLDINLPDGSGLDFVKKVRLRKNQLPILILTARDQTEQKVEGLDLGADDYLAKPFDLEELFARIRSLVRRSKGISSPTITHHDVVLNPINYSVYKGKNKVDLSPKEFQILKMLLENINKVVSKSNLEELLYSWDDSVESNTVEVHIHHLRKKLGTDFISTIRGAGYIIQ